MYVKILQKEISTYFLTGNSVSLASFDKRVIQVKQNSRDTRSSRSHSVHCYFKKKIAMLANLKEKIEMIQWNFFPLSFCDSQYLFVENYLMCIEHKKYDWEDKRFFSPFYFLKQILFRTKIQNQKLVMMEEITLKVIIAISPKNMCFCYLLPHHENAHRNVCL